MGRIRGYYEWDDDALTPGNKAEGGLHQNLFDETGKLRGSARFVPQDDGESEPVVVTETVFVHIDERRRSQVDEEFKQAVAELVSQLIQLAIIRSKPLVEQWWREKGRPALSHRAARLHRRRPSPGAVQGVVVAASPARSGQSVSDRQASDRPTMSTAEAQARFLAAVAAQAYCNEQMRLVAESDIIDGVRPQDLQRFLTELPDGSVEQLVAAVVADPSLLGEDSLAQMASLLGRRQHQVIEIPADS